MSLCVRPEDEPGKLFICHKCPKCLKRLERPHSQPAKMLNLLRMLNLSGKMKAEITKMHFSCLPRTPQVACGEG